MRDILSHTSMINVRKHKIPSCSYKHWIRCQPSRRNDYHKPETSPTNLLMIRIRYFDVRVRLRIIDGSTVLVDAHVSSVLVVDVAAAVERRVYGRSVAELDLAIAVLRVEDDGGVAGTLDLYEHDKGGLARGWRRVVRDRFRHFCDKYRLFCDAHGLVVNHYTYT